MSTFESGMLHHLQGVPADAIARGEESPWDALYAPPDMHHCLQRRTTVAIVRGDKHPYGGLYAPPADPCVANPPDKKATKKDKGVFDMGQKALAEPTRFKCTCLTTLFLLQSLASGMQFPLSLGSGPTLA
jgi:hypothetical protein